MAPKHKMTRMESSKEVRRVLNRNGVDLTYCQYSAAGKEVRLTGWLCKYDGTEFNAHNVEALVADFCATLAGHNIVGDLDNWSFSTDHMSHIGDTEEPATEEAAPEEDSEAKAS
jgi:hypothetical protein